MLPPVDSDQCSSIRVSPSTPFQLPLIHARSSRVGLVVVSAAATSAVAVDSRADRNMAALTATRAVSIGFSASSHPRSYVTGGSAPHCLVGACETNPPLLGRRDLDAACHLFGKLLSGAGHSGP